jgi:hypothetical protein
MDVHSVRRWRLALRLVSLGALIGVVAAVVWFGFAAAEASGGQMAAASAMFAAFACGWSGAFAVLTTRLRSAETAQV